MPLTNIVDRETFFRDPVLDSELPVANDVFWASLIEHVERDSNPSPRVVLDVGCHTGGLLHALSRRFSPTKVYGIEPLPSARVAAARLLDAAAAIVKLLDTSEWDCIPTGTVNLATSHEMLYLEPDLNHFMKRTRRVLAVGGVAYVVLGCHSENPLWHLWKPALVGAGHRVFDHAPLEIMAAASSAGLLPCVQPLRRSGWITYDPLRAEFPYPDVKTMFDHHYRYKLIFRLRAVDDRTISS